MAKVKIKKYDPTKNPYSSRYKGNIAESGLTDFSKKMIAARQGEGYSDSDKLSGDSGITEHFRQMSDEELRGGHPANARFTGQSMAGAIKKMDPTDYRKTQLAYEREVRRRFPSGTKKHHFLLGSNQGGEGGS